MSGTKPTELEQCLGSTQLTDLIKSCADNGVRKLSFGALVLEFSVDRPSDTDVSSNKLRDPRVEGPPLRDEVFLQTMREQIRDEYQRNQLILDDPEAFENQVIHEHLNPGRN